MEDVQHHYLGPQPSPSPHNLLGPRRPAFERDITGALLALNPEGHFLEPVKLQVLTARPTVQTLTRGAGSGRISRS
ncbi:hypothetical protein FXF51_46195 [Nonomuraea sp. PA05]|nr:hypothetical protein FXF51_46195 [Nonomuraea sp. PA05]